jgi:hypothetical protein
MTNELTGAVVLNLGTLVLSALVGFSAWMGTLLPHFCNTLVALV